MRTKLIAGNWKMNTTLADALVLATGIRSGLEHIERLEVVLCPPLIWLAQIAHDVVPVGQFPHLKLGAQNIYIQENGAFTGETSPAMAREVAEYVLIGHSERRHVFKENLELIAEKLHAAFQFGLTPILCLGEDEKSESSTRQLVHELNHMVKGLSQEQLEQLVVAYEPVWAISGGNANHQPATPEYVQPTLAAFHQALPEETRVIYGGSSNDENCRGFLELPECDGLLPGGASLKQKIFLTMCQIADDVAQSGGHRSLHPHKHS